METRKGKKIVRRYSESVKREIVNEIELGRLTVKDAMEWYDIPWRRSINRWQEKYGNNRRGTKIVRIVMKNEQERIRELEKLIAELELKNRFNETMLELWEEEKGEDTLKKNLNTEQWNEYVKLKQKKESL